MEVTAVVAVGIHSCYQSRSKSSLLLWKDRTCLCRYPLGMAKTLCFLLDQSLAIACMSADTFIQLSISG